MAAGFAMMGCQNLAAPAEVMQHIVNVESSTNPYAIGVVGAELVRPPKNIDEALATVQMLDVNGYNFSLGLAQVNRNNLARYGITSYEQAFQPCANLVAASRILAKCYASASGDWGKTFSCYYSGDFFTGYRDGYVQKIYDSISRTTRADVEYSISKIAPVPLIEERSTPAKPDVVTALDSAAYRVAMRSGFVDALAPEATRPPASALQLLSSSTSIPPTNTPANVDTTESDVFVPQVHGPGDPPPTLTTLPQPVAATSAIDQADLRQGVDDACFVF